MTRLAAALLLSLTLTACAGHPRVNPAVAAAQQVAEADALVRAGCYDCLADALAKYDQARTVPATVETATSGAVRAAVLLALRERELGFSESGYLAKARETAATLPEVQASMTPLLEVAASMPTQSGGQRGSQIASDAQLAAVIAAYRNREAWTERLRTRASEDALTAYLWLAFNCSFDTPTRDNVTAWLEQVPDWRDVPLLRFKTATCGSYDDATLGLLLAADARFVEADYFLGLKAILAGKLDEAADRLKRAYAWHASWPAVTQSIASVYMTAEEFDQAVDFYQRTLVLSPSQADALLGTAKALTYLGRNADAIATLDQLLALERWYVGDALYWRALNEVHLARDDEAWSDVELAAKLRVDAEVPKLAGIISYRRQRLDTARAKFEESRGRNPSDCETGFYLGVVLGDLRSWSDVPPVLADATACLQASKEDLHLQIEKVAASADPPEKKAKQIAKREKTIAQQERMLATSWFNLAVAYYNLQQNPEARRCAEKVASDEQFGARAREILSRIKQ